VYDASRVQVVHIIGDETTQTYQDQGIWEVNMKVSDSSVIQI
jgi:hypothetical protein